MSERVCVIGAGPSGMSFMYHLDQMKRKGLEVPDVVCYEKQADWGGQWNYDWRTGACSLRYCASALTIHIKDWIYPLESLLSDS